MMNEAQHYKAVMNGRRSKAAGEYWENMIEAACQHYRLKGIAEITKTPEPMRPIKSLGQGKFIAHYEKMAQPDYKGTLAGGKAVVFEAKHTDSDRIEQSRLTDEQVESLSTHHSLGAAAFVLVSVGLQDFFRVPWEVWRDMKDIYGHKHMKLAELEPYRVQYIVGVLKLLEGIEITKYREESE